MFDNLATESTIISVLSVKFDAEDPEDSESCTMTVRVLNESRWKKLIGAMLKASAEGDDFGVVVKQEFYLNAEAKPAFVWIVSVWGDLSAADAALSPILNKRGGPPPPPASLGVSAPVFNKKPQAKAMVKNDGTIVKEIPLPHKRSQVSNTDEVINVRDPNARKSGRAFVTGLTGT